MLTELEKFRLWEKRMNKVGPAITGILVAGFILVLILITVA